MYTRQFVFDSRRLARHLHEFLNQSHHNTPPLAASVRCLLFTFKKDGTVLVRVTHCTSRTDCTHTQPQTRTTNHSPFPPHAHYRRSHIHHSTTNTTHTAHTAHAQPAASGRRNWVGRGRGGGDFSYSRYAKNRFQRVLSWRNSS